MPVRRLLGPLILIVLVVAVGFAVLLSTKEAGRQRAARAVVTVRGLVGSEKEAPRLAAHGAADATFADVRSTATTYLPDTLNAYLAVPAAYRNTAVIADGQTARQIVVAQLTVLDAKIKEIAENVTADDAQALLANGRFLKERFATAPMFRPA